MFLRLLLAFTLIPLAELTLLLKIGQWLGAGTTLALVVLTGMAGAWLARREGTRAWANVRSELADGRLPDRELLHALLVLVSGVLLVTPGVLTDAAGLLLLIQPLRAALVGRVRYRFSVRAGLQVSGAAAGSSAGDSWHRPSRRGEAMEPHDAGGGGRVIEI